MSLRRGPESLLVHPQLQVMLLGIYSVVAGSIDPWVCTVVWVSNKLVCLSVSLLGKLRAFDNMCMYCYFRPELAHAY